ncbi:PorP/SprF family type IX secretion system membrane protein [Portibacter marinus]|uniref:PorP/SprF family type IX secretion system membrane protein n=1 Tax=Portibacter marinus TaxID=2898660 RepID=UPI001F2B3C2F|nr:PorP/SprF family type IX secretion system membrane protein [Portibacter marinus]
MKFNITIITLLLFSIGLSGQDLHYSMFQMSPVGLNPALSGAFSGTARVGGVYRIQDVIANSQATAANRGYETYTAYIDAPVLRGVREQDWIGIGIGLASDVAGIGNLRQTTSVQAISYHMPLGRAGRNTLSFAISSGTTNLSVRRVDRYTFESTILGQGPDPQTQEFQDPENSRTKGDFGGGIVLKSNIDEVSAFRGGISLAHLNSPKRAISSGGSSRTPVRITAFAEYDRVLNDRTKIIPAMIFQNFGQSNEVAFQAITGYYFDPEKDITVYGGLGARINFLNPIDAIPIYLGFDMKDLQVRLAYDATVSSKVYTNRGFGALEISANYIMKIYKRPKVDPAVFCPRF